MSDLPQSPPPGAGYTATLLLVDDEENILSALKRLLRSSGYRILTATGGAAGLTLLESETVDLVVSDMRMPEMDGARFLEQVAARWPHIVRILLTGYSDLSSTVAAVNKGGIYRYISKPWEDNDLKLTLHQALERKRLEEEKRRLEALTQRQNEALRDLNASLEDKVRARTAELQQTADMLDMAYQESKRSYVTAIPVFAGLVEMREGKSSGHGRRVAEAAKTVAQRLGMNEENVEHVYFAGLLHDIGKIGLPDALVHTPYESLGPGERARFETHPALGAAALMALDTMSTTAQIIRAHHERYDGKGYPDQIMGDSIPLGARVLAVVNDFDALLHGRLMAHPVPADKAIAFIEAHRGQRYDPRVVDTFITLVKRIEEPKSTNEAKLGSEQLRPGMVLSRDLVSPDGLLLLARGHRLTEGVINRIKNFELDTHRTFAIHVEVS